MFIIIVINVFITTLLCLALVIPQNEYGILVITQDQGAAEVEC